MTEESNSVRLSGFFIFLLSFVILISTTILVFVKYSGPKFVKIPSLSIPITTSSWQTYTNQKYGFEFKYPSAWEISNSEESNGSLKTDLNNNIDFYVVNDSSKTITEYLQKADKIAETAWEGLPSYQVRSTKITVINGLNCIQREEYLIAADLTRINTYFKKGNIVISISLNPPPGNPLSEDKLSYDRLLSTFKFTETVSIGCKIGGCNGEICHESDIAIKSACLYKPEYACLKYAVCEEQTLGKCGWTKTPEYQSCLQNLAQ